MWMSVPEWLWASLAASEHKVSKHRSCVANSKLSDLLIFKKNIDCVQGMVCRGARITGRPETLGVFRKMTCVRNSHLIFLGFVEAWRDVKAASICSCLSRVPALKDWKTTIKVLDEHQWYLFAIFCQPSNLSAARHRNKNCHQDRWLSQVCGYLIAILRLNSWIANTRLEPHSFWFFVKLDDWGSGESRSDSAASEGWVETLGWTAPPKQRATKHGFKKLQSVPSNFIKHIKPDSRRATKAESFEKLSTCVNVCWGTKALWSVYSKQTMSALASFFGNNIEISWNISIYIYIYILLYIYYIIYIYFIYIYIIIYIYNIIYIYIRPGRVCCPGKCVLTAQGQCFMRFGVSSISPDGWQDLFPKHQTINLI